MPPPLPTLRFELGDWQEQDFASLRENTETLSAMAQSAGTGSRRFEEAQQALLTAASLGEQALYDRLRRPIDIRALSYLLCRQGNDARQIQLTPQLVSRLTGPRRQISTLTLMNLISVWFRHDRFNNPQGLRALGRLLQTQLEQRQNTRRTVMLSLFIEHRALLFSVDAASRLVKRAHASGNFETIIEQYGLTAQKDSRLVTLARACYYVACLEALSAGADSPLLNKVTQPEIRDAPLDGEGELIGHAVLRSLISRADASSVSDAWRNTILSIAGDPRVPQGHLNYLNWWSRLEPALTDKVRGWLAGFDLKLFLSALEQYGNHTKNEDLQRMYPARKLFLEGLLEQGLVNNTRLFISRNMKQYLIQAFREEELPTYAIVRDQLQRSMIYLNVAGVHILEGSHNRAIYGVPRLPQASRILDFGIREFHERALGKGLLEKYAAESNGHRCDQLEVRHSPKTFNWQHQVIQYLQLQGVTLDIEKLFTPQDYFRYKRIHGLG